MLMVMTPFAAFVSAEHTYGSFEDHCDFSMNDAEGDAYTPIFIQSLDDASTVIEVEPSTYMLVFGCSSMLESGTIQVTVDGHSHDGVTTNDPVTVIHASTTTANVVSSMIPVAVDASGVIGNSVVVHVSLDAVDTLGDTVDTEHTLTFVPMVDTTADETPRISMWYGKVNQHNENGTWLTDPDGVSGSGLYADWGHAGWGDRKLEYCQKFWPQTESIEKRPFMEKMWFFHMGNVDGAEAYKDVYECVQANQTEIEEDEDRWDDLDDLSCNNTTELEEVFFFSNASTTVVSQTGQSAQAINAHPAWTADLGEAQWVWNTSTGYGFIGAVEFTHELVLPSTASSVQGILAVAADNSYDVSLNGAPLGGQTDEWNFLFEHMETFSMDSFVQPGVNVLTFDVDNWHVIGGLMYAGVVQFCSEPVDEIDDGVEDGTDGNDTDDGWGNGTDDGTGNGTDDDSGDDSTGNGTDDGTGNGTDDNSGDDSTDNGTGNITEPCVCNGEIKYVLLQEQWGSFDHQIWVKSQSLTLGYNFTVEWRLTNDDTGALVANGSESWDADASTHMTRVNHLDLEPAAYCLEAKLFSESYFMSQKTYCKVVVDAAPFIKYTGLQEQWASFDYEVKTKIESLREGFDYELQWHVVNSDTQADVINGSENWTATQSTQLVSHNGIDLEPGHYCVVAELFESGLSVDSKTYCKTVEENGANIKYGFVEEQYGTFDHRVVIKSQSLTSTSAYQMVWILNETNNGVVVASGDESWATTASIHMTYHHGLELGEGSYQLSAELYQDGVLVDSHTSSYVIACESSSEPSSQGTPSMVQSTDITPEADDDATTDVTNSEDGDGASGMVEVLKAIASAIVEWFTDLFSKAEPKNA